MALPAALVLLGKTLLANGLPVLANAVLGKGKEKVEELIGMKIPDIATAKPEELLALKQAEFDHEEKLLEMALTEQAQTVDWMKTETQEVTKRWQADMSADSWLSKNIRPLALAFLLGTLATAILASWWEVTTPDSLLALLKTWGEIVLVAYFGGRTIEKGASIIRRRRNESA